MTDPTYDPDRVRPCRACGAPHRVGDACVPNYREGVLGEWQPGGNAAPFTRTNLEDALEIVAEIDLVRAVIRELRAAFARNELDGGVRAASEHPLYKEAKAKLAKLAELHERLLGLI